MYLPDGAEVRWSGLACQNRVRYLPGHVLPAPDDGPQAVSPGGRSRGGGPRRGRPDRGREAPSRAHTHAVLGGPQALGLGPRHAPREPVARGARTRPRGRRHGSPRRRRAGGVPRNPPHRRRPRDGGPRVDGDDDGGRPGGRAPGVVRRQPERRVDGDGPALRGLLQVHVPLARAGPPAQDGAGPAAPGDRRDRRAPPRLHPLPGRHPPERPLADLRHRPGPRVRAVRLLLLRGLPRDVRGPHRHRPARPGGPLAAPRVAPVPLRHHRRDGERALAGGARGGGAR